MSINLNHFKEMLLMRKAEIEKILNDISNEINDISQGEIKDEGDYASASLDSSRDYQLYVRLKTELTEINQAIERIEKGTYGICEMCDEPIEEERLKIKPYAKYCIICREIIEKEKK
jgi:DnaK suppressor protein